MSITTTGEADETPVTTLVGLLLDQAALPWRESPSGWIQDCLLFNL